MQESVNKIPRSRKSKLEDDDLPVKPKQFPAKPKSKRAQRAAKEANKVVEIGIPEAIPQAPVVPAVSDSLTQVETKPDTSYQAPEEETMKGREMVRPTMPADAESPVQVETKEQTADTEIELPGSGVDASGIIAPQYAPRNMQKEVEAQIASAKELEAEEQREIDARIEAVRAGSDVPTLTDEITPEPQYAVWRRGAAHDLGSLGEPVELSVSEGTPQEEKNKFREFMTRAKEKLNVERMKEYSVRRSTELDEKAKEYGSVTESLFRSLGKKYDKLGRKTKIAVGMSLGVGAVAFTGVSVPAALTFTLGLATQRVAGMASMFIKFEKHLQDTGAGKAEGFFAAQKWYQKIAEGSEQDHKIKAAVMSLGYMLGMSALVAEGMQVASETEAAHAVQRWLGDMLGHHSVAPVAPEQAHPAPSQVAVGQVASAPSAVAEAVPPVPEAPATVPPAEAPAPAPTAQPAAVAAAGEASASAQAPNAPHVAGETSIPVPAPAAEIPSAATSIEVKATPGKGYEYMMKRLWEQLHEKNIELPANANPDSDLARLLAADKDSIDTVVHDIAADPKHQFFHTDGSSVRIEPDAQMTIGARGELHLSGEKYDYQVAPPQAPVTPTLHPEVPTPPTPPAESIPHIDIPSPEPVGTVDLIASPNEVLVPAPETVISNRFGLVVHTNEAHLYADSSDQNFFAYGGSQEEKVKTITEYLTKHPSKVIYAEDGVGHRVPWFRNLEGAVTQGPPLRTDGFLGLFSSFLKPPTPDDFGKIIK